jgi:hypothetical protein
MNDSVKYQLERAVDALRTAVKLGASVEDAYLLRNIVETINTIEGWQTSSRYKYNISKETIDDSIKFTMSGYDPDYNITINSGADEMPYRYYGISS